jgi:hypothetical protein
MYPNMQNVSQDQIKQQASMINGMTDDQLKQAAQ